MSKTLQFSQTKVELLLHLALHFLWNILQTKVYLTAPANNFWLQIFLKRPFRRKDDSLKKVSVRKLISYTKKS